MDNFSEPEHQDLCRTFYQLGWAIGVFGYQTTQVITVQAMKHTFDSYCRKCNFEPCAHFVQYFQLGIIDGFKEDNENHNLDALFQEGTTEESQS